MIRFNSVLTKLGLLVIAGIFVTTVALVSYSTWASRQMARRLATDKAQSMITDYGSRIKNRLDRGVHIARTLSQTFGALEPGQITRTDADAVLQSLLNANDFVFGTWTCWEPDAFDRKDAEYRNTTGHDETGRYIPYFIRDEKGQPVEEPLAGYEDESAEWYQGPKKNRKDMVTPPFYYKVQDKDVMMMSIASPVLRGKKFCGVSGVDIAVDWFQEFLETWRKPYGTDVTFIILAHDGKIAGFSGKPEWLGKSVKDVYPDTYRQILESVADARSGTRLDDHFLSAWTPFVIGQTTTPWQIRIDVSRDLIMKEANSMMKRQIIISMGILCLITGLMVFFTRRMVRPLVELVTATEKISDGHLFHHINVRQNDEIGTLADRFRNMVARLREVIGEIRGGTGRFVAASSELSNASHQLSEGASQQAAALEEISAAMEQMASNIAQTADNARQTEQIALRAATEIIESQKAVDETVEAMKTISEEILVINEISTRTDMLAINAAIEASKADQHGKGFATVASQVKSLSEKTQKAAKRIEKLSRSSIRIAEKSVDMLGKIVPDVQSTHHLIQEISAACVEQNSGATQVNDSVYQLNLVVQQNAAAAEQMASSAGELEDQADRLSQTIAFFKMDEDVADVELSEESRHLIDTFILRLKETEGRRKKAQILAGSGGNEEDFPEERPEPEKLDLKLKENAQDSDFEDF